MDRKMLSKASQAIDALRKPKVSSLEQTIVEPVLGQTKDARGLDHFLLRSAEKVSGECQLIASTHNILKMF